jgi:DNA-binding Lrp family transcriptional regulator
MADPKQKEDKRPSPRTVGPKHPVKLPSLQRIRMPHEDLIRPGERRQPEIAAPAQTEIKQNTEVSQVLQTSQVSETSLDSQTRLVSNDIPDWSGTSLDSQTRLVPETNQVKSRLDLMTSLPDVKGFLRIHFQVLDHLYPQLDPFERAVHETLYRLSWGFNKSSCTISYQGIAKRTGMSPKSAQRAAGRLEQKGLISKSNRIIGYQKEQGIEFSVVPPPRLVAETRQVSQTRLVPQTNIIETTTQIENTQTQAGVGVGSRFTLDECRQYADHLKATGQGITNPGGYATKIFRSGEVDSLIESFLKPEIDISRCPDCSGSGHVYVDPQNLDKGVRPCKHSPLR